MRQILILLSLSTIIFVSCKKDTTNDFPHGLFIENNPVSGRSQLNFINNHLVVKSETGSSYKDTFIYSFSANKIILTPSWTNQYPAAQLEFKKIDENSFQIENLYASIPEAPKSYMIYKK